MTERGGGSMTRSQSRLSIGPSALRFENGRLDIDLDEWTVPIPRRLRGRISIDLGPVFDTEWPLDLRDRHHWRPIAPMATAQVSLESPNIAWQGRAYVDMNEGSEPLEAAFVRWNWSREDRGDVTRILYDLEDREGDARGLAFDYGSDGRLRHVETAPRQELRRTGWRVARSTRSESGRPARIMRTLEDTPFYSRTMLATQGDSGRHVSIHESVDLDRFRSRWVQTLLPFKMPRKAW